MKRLFLTFLTIVAVVGLLAIAPAAHAQDAASLTATVDRDQLSVDETLVLTLTLLCARWRSAAVIIALIG